MRHLPELLAVHPLATTNAVLNGVATCLLVAAYVLIKRRREIAHRNVMLAAFGVSVAFLASYLTYHFVVLKGTYGQTFGGTGLVRQVYYAILASHVLLAAAVPFLAVGSIYLGLRDRRLAHRRLAQWAFPIWLYVSITGVIVYWMLYHMYQ
jgi:uncharacterized membrane protein YozB (DUF420 family)